MIYDKEYEELVQGIKELLLLPSMGKLKFPPYEKIKELHRFKRDHKLEIDRPIEYAFNLFDIYKHVYCRMTYNEDGSDLFYLDIMCDGYSNSFSHKNRWFEVSEKGYGNLIVEATQLYEKILINLFRANEKYEQEWFKE